MWKNVRVTKDNHENFEFHRQYKSVKGIWTYLIKCILSV